MPLAQALVARFAMSALAAVGRLDCQGPTATRLRVGGVAAPIAEADQFEQFVNFPSAQASRRDHVARRHKGARAAPAQRFPFGTYSVA